MSGYLHQSKCKSGVRGYFSNLGKKFIDLGVPYVSFSLAAYILKALFEEGINNPNERGIFEMLIFQPDAPYWFLYILMFIFVVTPKFNSKYITAVFTVISIVFAVIYELFFSETNMPYVIEWTSKSWMWFTLGMLTSQMNLSERKIRLIHILPWYLFIPVSIFIYIFNIEFLCMDILMGIAGCAMVIATAMYISVKIPGESDTSRIVKYTMPIFLMHTIASPAVRVILLKLHVSSIPLHLILGGAAGIILPVLAGYLMHLTVIPEIFLYPIRTYRRLKNFRKVIKLRE